MTVIYDDINRLLLPRYLLNDTYPFPESTQLEFKKTFHVNQHAKYRETICAFLNTNGGHIIFGVMDNCLIIGNTLSDNEKDHILLFIDATYTILKTSMGDTMTKDKIKVHFEEIAKSIYIVIISCYKNNDNNHYQFLAGDSWIRMNASNMKTNYGKLYSVHDVSIIKLKFHKRFEESIKKIKKEYSSCEKDTIVTVSNIFENKFKKEKELLISTKNSKYVYISNILLFVSLMINSYFIFEKSIYIYT
jgi:predicted HTH transcriptional regulator